LNEVQELPVRPACSPCMLAWQQASSLMSCGTLSPPVRTFLTPSCPQMTFPAAEQGRGRTVHPPRSHRNRGRKRKPPRNKCPVFPCLLFPLSPLLLSSPSSASLALKIPPSETHRLHHGRLSPILFSPAARPPSPPRGRWIARRRRRSC